jgi:Baseplate J-like protein
MKTYIIQLEEHDDLISVRDKMSWAKSERILLVWPPRRKANIRSLDLVLLQRHAQALGAQLGIASRSGEIRRSATESHIPVFKTSSEAQLADWNDAIIKRPALVGGRRRLSRTQLNRMRKNLNLKQPAWTRNIYARIGIFSFGVLAVLIIFIIFLPSAKVKITPVQQNQSITITVTIDPSSSAVNISGVVPAYPVSTTVEGDSEMPATGKMTIPELQASGKVQFTNLGETRVQIAEGTVVRTVVDPAVRFLVTRAGEVPGGVGQKIELPVRAVDGGPAGNLKPDTLQAIEGALGLNLSVTNLEPTSGGGNVEKTTATTAERTQLFNRLSDSLSQQAWENMLAQVPAGGTLLHGSQTSEATSAAYNPPEGSSGSTLSLDLKQNEKAYYITENDLRSLGNLVLDASIPSGFEPLSDTLVIKPVGEPEVKANGQLAWQIRFDRSVAAHIVPLEVISIILGKTPKTAAENLSALINTTSSQISLTPSWWPWVPALPMRISVELVNQ